jgi:hypothetical protein
VRRQAWLLWRRRCLHRQVAAVWPVEAPGLGKDIYHSPYVVWICLEHAVCQHLQH